MRTMSNSNIANRARRRWAAAALAAAAFVIAACFQTRAEAVSNFEIRIGVAEDVKSGNLRGKGLALTDARGARLSVADGSAISASGGGISVAGKSLALPVRVSAKSGLGWDKTRYRGTISIIRARNGFSVVNDLDLESYLRGILKMEMNPEWPFEALKAQAVLARTYAVKNRGRDAAKGYDLGATDSSQVYRGMNAEDPRTDKAVAETRGMILTWRGAAADAYYHSDSGGATADISHVWGGSSPYLQVRAERVSYTSPNSTWRTTLSALQISSIMSKMGQNVGRVRSVEVAQRDQAGRSVTLRVTGDAGSAVVKSHAFRMAAGSGVIRSTNFNISAPSGAAGTPQADQTRPDGPPRAPAKPGGADPLIEMTNGDVFTKAEMMDMLMNPGKREEYLRIGYQRIAGKPSAPPQAKPAQRQPAIDTVSDGNFVFSGKGWGHGVGLSQWGAKAMAETGSRFEDILAHYFPGTEIGK
ncbi:MAG: SpoIID/LytB domain-containing protein [Synergistaceae bacterium]|jgi:stage II sporulation protein D|nr:SpoIID/LytB domain-containing protein [Synergistaceae bacterium]